MYCNEDVRFTTLSATCEDYRCCTGCADEYEIPELRNGYCPGCIEILNYELELAAQTDELPIAA
jgi:hypothetical protein